MSNKMKVEVIETVAPLLVEYKKLRNIVTLADKHIKQVNNRIKILGKDGVGVSPTFKTDVCSIVCSNAIGGVVYEHRSLDVKYHLDMSKFILKQFKQRINEIKTELLSYGVDIENEQ